MTADKHGGECRIYILPCECAGCRACHELEPECIGWDEEAEKAFVKAECVDESTAERLMSYCPRDCIEIIG